MIERTMQAAVEAGKVRRLTFNESELIDRVPDVP